MCIHVFPQHACHDFSHPSTHVTQTASPENCRHQELSWGKRLDMLRDVAAGMVFLHSRRPPVIHGDLRSPNLLLDLTFDGTR